MLFIKLYNGNTYPTVRNTQHLEKFLKNCATAEKRLYFECVSWPWNSTLVVTSFVSDNGIYGSGHWLWTPSEEIAITARPKINSYSQIFWYGQSIFCLPHWPKFSYFFDLCLHWVSVVRGSGIWFFLVQILSHGLWCFLNVIANGSDFFFGHYVTKGPSI